MVQSKKRLKMNNDNQVFRFASKSRGMLIFLRFDGRREVVRFEDHNYMTKDPRIAEELKKEGRFGREFFEVSEPVVTNSPFKTFRDSNRQETRVIDLSKDKKIFGRGTSHSMGAEGQVNDLGETSENNSVE
jgi:hypothetical protein